MFKVNNKDTRTTSLRNWCEIEVRPTEAYSEPCQTSKMELFAIVMFILLTFNKCLSIGDMNKSRNKE